MSDIVNTLTLIHGTYSTVDELWDDEIDNAQVFQYSTSEGDLTALTSDSTDMTPFMATLETQKNSSSGTTPLTFAA